MENKNPQTEPEKKQIKIADNIPGAEYSNAAQFQFNKDEMQMIYLNLFSGSGRVSAKIVTSPGHFKRMISAMTEAMGKYEKQFGEVKETEPVAKEIGFKG
ncbi:MAG TPA: DUF3467 domain-containing protein [Patescibacteria group bacterium]|nr:DUF3467 domain-containing protein [Patescibacteria group bacterium]